MTKHTDQTLSRAVAASSYHTKSRVCQHQHPHTVLASIFFPSDMWMYTFLSFLTVSHRTLSVHQSLLSISLLGWAGRPGLERDRQYAKDSHEM